MPPDTDTDAPHLHCLECEYDLTGLPNTRCPECGTDFDPDWLRMVIAGSPQAAQPVSPDDNGTWVGFVRMVLTVWYTPREFARGFPPRHDPDRATAFSMVCYAIGAAILICTGIAFALIERMPALVIYAFVLACTGAFTCWVCEVSIAAMLKLVLRPTRAPDRWHFWRGLTHYFSAYWILTTAYAVLMLALVYFDIAEGWNELIPLGLPLVVIYWMATLILAVDERATRGPTRVLPVFLIPVIAVASIVLGYAVATLAVFSCVTPFL